MYKERLILFIDLLGFKSIVNRSVRDEEFLASIYELLKGITAEPVSTETFGQLNRQLVPKERLAEVEELNKLFSAGIKANSTLAVTHFSDSLVISAEVEDTTSTFSILELAAKLTFRLWEEHKVLTRGGVTIGKLIHEEGGVLIGPAMVRAYELESKLAVVPRILIDENCIDYIRESHLYEAMKRLFAEVGELTSEDGEAHLNKGLEINLGTIYHHFLLSLYGAAPVLRKRYERSLKTAVADLTAIRDAVSKPEVKAKYDYAITEVERMISGFTFWEDIKVD